MKRALFFLLLPLLLLLCACGEDGKVEELTQPALFYYRTAQTGFSAEDGVIRAELRDLGAESYSDQRLFELYFEGPKREDLISPFSQDTELVSASRRGATLELQLTRSANSPAEFSHSLGYACLAKTGLALDGVSKVRIRVSSRGGVLEDDVLLTESDILLFDDGSIPKGTNITLYYMDEAGTFLLTEKREAPLLSQEELPRYALEQLMEVRQNGGMRSALPPGTAILVTSVENGVCTVDFNGDFYTNRPQDEQDELLTVLSVVNTLCELEGINQVQIYAQGQSLSPYTYLDLSQPWLPDSAPVGPIREELGEFAGTLCLPGLQDGLLHRMTVRTRTRGGISKEEALLQALIGRTAQNGLLSPLSGAPTPLSISTKEQICTVTLAAGTLPEDARTKELALRSITATLCALPGVRAVRLLENDTAVTSEPLSPDESWFCQP